MNSIGRGMRRAAQGGAALLALVLLASCGGGTEAITPYNPTRLLILGDEMSVMTKDGIKGRKYSVNAVGADQVSLDCVLFPLWHQVVAYTWGFAYEECNPGNQAVTAARIYAVPGAKVDDLPQQLEAARLVNGSFSKTDLFMVLVGQNDVVDLYENVYRPDPTTANYNAVIAELQARGVRLAAFVNRLSRADVGDLNGPKVIISTIPLLNLTPYARAQAAAYPGINVWNTLLAFSQALNTAMRAGDGTDGNRGIVNDGRFLGLVELDSLLNAGYNNPENYGLYNTLYPVCVATLPDCWNVPADLAPGGNAVTWMWASDLWMGTTAQVSLGNFARGRALGNPF